MSDDFRLVNRGYSLFPTLYDEYFETEGIQVQISSKHFETACNESVSEVHLIVNCSRMVSDYWPGYHAGRSFQTLFYGRVEVTNNF